MKVDFEEVLEVVKNNKGKIIILNGTMNVGKTTTAIRLGEYFSKDLNTPTIAFSLNEFCETKVKNKSNNFIIDETEAIPIKEMKSKILDLRIKRKIEFVIIDFIQLVTFDNRQCLSFNVQQKLIMEELIKMSKELNITFFVTHLIPKKGKERYNIEVI